MDNRVAQQHWEKYQKGDEHAFTKLVEGKFNLIFHFILGKINNRETAGELTNKLWLKLSANKSAQINNFNSYLIAAAHNLLKDEYLSKKRRKKHENIEDVQLKKAVYNIFYDNAEREDKLLRAKLLLTGIEFEILLLMLDGYPIEEIAEKTGFKEATVRNKISIIRKKLTHLKGVNL